MALQRYQDTYSGCEPDGEGDFVKFEDVLSLLDTISKYDTDMSPRAVAIKVIFEEIKGE